MFKCRIVIFLAVFFFCGCNKRNVPNLEKKQGAEEAAKENVAEITTTVQGNENYEYEIIDPKDGCEFDGDMHFFGLRASDSFETAKAKLMQSNCNFESGTDYAGVSKIWNKGIIIEEWENMDFILHFFDKRLYSLTKWSLNKQEAQHICDYYGRNFDVSTLKSPQYYIIKEGDWIVDIGNNRSMYVVTIYNKKIAETVKKLYDSFD